MGDIGNAALIIAFTLSIYTIVVSVIGAAKRRNDLLISAERSVITTFVMLCAASFALLTLLAKSDFHYQYVWSYSNKALPMCYKLAAFWAGQIGSLLLWLLIISAITAAAAYQNRNRNRDLMPYVLMVFGIVTAFFSFVCLFLTNPFTELVIAGQNGTLPYTPPDGIGLNPLLQHPVMVIHPPILFVGYSGFIVTFAFAIAALITRQLDAFWLSVTRRWTIFSWLFLGAGIILGAKWAYVELGWGGYWGWDPIENASLLPWLTGTAVLHSSMIQEKRGMLKTWNMSLIMLTFILCIFGTFLTRSGIVSSVHAFGQSSIGSSFGFFLLFLFIGSFSLLLTRVSYLRSENKLDSLLSRESTFLFNNLIFVGAMAVILLGTIAPVISELITGSQISVGIPYYLSVNIPIGLFLLFLIGAGPLFAWRKTSAKSLKRNFLYPLSFALVTGILLFAGGLRQFMPFVSFFLCAFVAASIVQEYIKGTRPRHKISGEPYLKAFINIILRNPRRYGGYLVHLSIVLMFIGFTGGAFIIEATGELTEGQSITAGDYELTVERIHQGGTSLYEFSEVRLHIKKDNRDLTYKNAQRRFYYASEQATSELAIYSTLTEDLYIVYSGMISDGKKAVIQVHVNPLVMWVWIGGIVLAVGGVIILIPNIRNRQDDSVKTNPAASKSKEEIAS